MTKTTTNSFPAIAEFLNMGAVEIILLLIVLAFIILIVIIAILFFRKWRRFK